jgi:hypothetical protein
MPSDPARGTKVDALLYAVAAVFAAGVLFVAGIPQFREWGRIAVGPYAAGAVAALWLARVRASTHARIILAAGVFLGAAILPMALETVWRSHTEPGLHAQSEVIVTEEATRALVDGRDPYVATYVHGPLAARPLPTKTHYPYLPGMLAFGLPRAIDGRSALADARVWFAAFALAALALAFRRSGANPEAKLRVAQVTAVLPTGALLMATGGDDLPVLALMLLGLVLLEARPGWAGLVAGAAAVLKQTAWPLLPFLVVASPDRRKTATSAAGLMLFVLTPFALWNPGAFVEDALKFPLGLGTGVSAAGTPTLGSLLADVLPAGRTVSAGVFVVAVLGAAGWLLARRPWPGARGAARSVAIVWVVAFVLAPSARFGYLAYQVNLFVWSAVLWAPHRVPSARTAIA